MVEQACTLSIPVAEMESRNKVETGKLLRISEVATVVRRMFSMGYLGLIPSVRTGKCHFPF